MQYNKQYLYRKTRPQSTYLAEIQGASVQAEPGFSSTTLTVMKKFERYFTQTDFTFYKMW